MTQNSQYIQCKGSLTLNGLLKPRIARQSIITMQSPCLLHRSIHLPNHPLLSLRYGSSRSRKGGKRQCHGMFPASQVENALEWYSMAPTQDTMLRSALQIEPLRKLACPYLCKYIKSSVESSLSFFRNFAGLEQPLSIELRIHQLPHPYVVASAKQELYRKQFRNTFLKLSAIWHSF